MYLKCIIFINYTRFSEIFFSHNESSYKFLLKKQSQKQNHKKKYLNVIFY